MFEILNPTPRRILLPSEAENSVRIPKSLTRVPRAFDFSPTRFSSHLASRSLNKQLSRQKSRRVPSNDTRTCIIEQSCKKARVQNHERLTSPPCFHIFFNLQREVVNAFCSFVVSRMRCVPNTRAKHFQWSSATLPDIVRYAHQ